MAMKAFLTAMATVVLLAGASSARPLPAELPTNGKAFSDDANEVRFVIVGDRTAKHRPGVFERAMRQVNLLAPQFVVSVGDFIEGYIDDQAEIDRRWNEVRDATAAVESPFFYVVGNNDISNETMGRVWDRRLGRRYYSFAHRDVLFIALDTEDPPPPESDRRILREKFSVEERQAAGRLSEFPAEERNRELAANPRLAEMTRLSQASERVSISRKQLDWVRKELARHPGARWTFFLMHRPGWKYDSPEFREIERMSRGRRHSFIAGHYHAYDHSRKADISYIQMGPTGAATRDQNGDHVLLVTLRDGPPKVAYVGLEAVRTVDAQFP